MILALAEFKVLADQQEAFEHALTEMQARLRKFDGFLGDEPCRSLSEDGKLVTVSFWRDRDALKAWHDDPEHRRIQKLGRDDILSWYRIRVAEVERDYSWTES